MKFLILLSAASILSCSTKMTARASSSASVDTASWFVVTSDLGTKTPICISQKIEAIKQERIWNPPAEIHEYVYEGKSVFAISADCCDRFTTVVDSVCNFVCSPSGGFTGRGDGKCGEFFQKAKHIRLVWKDERLAAYKQTALKQL